MRTREEGRLGSPEGRRPVTRCRKRRWNFACHIPSTFARKATMFEPLWKNSKMREKQEKCKFEQSEHWFVALGSAISGTKHKGTTWDRQRSCKSGPTTAKKNTENATKLTAHSSHHCPKSSKIPQKHGNNDNLMSKIDQQRVLCFRNL